MQYADNAFTSYQRGMSSQRADAAVSRCPLPEEPLGVAAMPEARLVAHGGGVRLCQTLWLDDGAESGVTERQGHIDRRQRADGRG